MKTEFFQTEIDITYAILSHRWQENEVLFHDLQSGHARQKSGYAKLESFCKQAAADGFTYAWCDMCCIDKSSSAELSESINSMFRWYQNAVVCYAYLIDITITSIQDDASEFTGSEWFRRGWCLQELLAPPNVQFFNRDWKSLGMKAEFSQLISDITKIHHGAICGRDLDEYSIAQRMSWAADRQTTRIEDIAYSLLGIFKVNMPLLYGEGERAFKRLQQEIIRESNDQSILVFSENGSSQQLLAKSPTDFRDSSHIVRSDTPLTGEPFTLTNIGLSMDVMLLPWSLDTNIALLDCRHEREPDQHVGIFLRLQPQIMLKDDKFSTDHALRVKVGGRSWTNNPCMSCLPSVHARIHVEDKDSEKVALLPKRYGYWIRKFGGRNISKQNEELFVLSWNKWNESERLLEIPEGRYATAGILQVGSNNGTPPFSDLPMVLRLGFSPKFEPVIEFGINYAWPHLESLSKKEAILSNVEWTTKKRSSMVQGVIVNGTDRSSRIKKGFYWENGNIVEVFCEKIMIKGAETWALDVLWELNSQSQPQVAFTNSQGSKRFRFGPFPQQRQAQQQMKQNYKRRLV